MGSISFGAGAPSGIAKKMAEIMKQVQYIQKRGKNSFHNYTYATEADVNDKLREHMADVNVSMIPSVKATTIRETVTQKGATEYIAKVEMEFTFIDGDSGEYVTFCMEGEGQDRGDKAIYKAISGCQKYALMKAFMIPTGDDPERDDEKPSAPEAPKANVAPIRGGKGKATDTAMALKDLADYAGKFEVDPKTLRQQGVLLFGKANPAEWTLDEIAQVKQEVRAIYDPPVGEAK